MSFACRFQHQIVAVKQEFMDAEDIVCVLCDNGGDVLLREGTCRRAFHPTVQSGVHSQCQSLGFSNVSEYEALEKFLCPNCTYNMHQCFICAELGSTELSSDSKVYPCSTNNFGRYYHPECVCVKIHSSDYGMALNVGLNIICGTSFTCPIHRFRHCGGVENPSDAARQFAVCRRSPVSYHRMCLTIEKRCPSIFI